MTFQQLAHQVLAELDAAAIPTPPMACYYGVVTSTTGSTYQRLKWTRERGDAARAYRRLRKDNPAMARIIWKMDRMITEELSATIAGLVLKGVPPK